MLLIPGDKGLPGYHGYEGQVGAQGVAGRQGPAGNVNWFESIDLSIFISIQFDDTL